eukprot:scaffold193177_cov21-Tisochrysis_lutea.AAC.1
MFSPVLSEAPQLTIPTVLDTMQQSWKHSPKEQVRGLGSKNHMEKDDRKTARAMQLTARQDFHTNHSGHTARHFWIPAKPLTPPFPKPTEALYCSNISSGRV